MHLTYLVDGYNLLFALGLLDARSGDGALERARRRLLDYLCETFGDGDHGVTVVFDSARAPPRASAIQEYRGIHVQFATDGEFADDVIERLLAECAAPRQLVVISNDHRLRDGARRKGARTWTSADFLDHGEARRNSPGAPASAPAERATPTRDEVQHWLAEFGDIANDPEFREVFERFPFEDEEGEPDVSGPA